MEKIKIDILVIGGGIAGITFAENYKKINPASEVCVVERENNSLYSRVLLPNFVKKQIPQEKVFIRTKNQITEKGITYHLNEEINNVNYENKTATSNAYIYEFKKLVIATGGNARSINSTNENVFQLQTLKDATNLSSYIDNLEEGSNSIVVGGGFIGIEFLEIFKLRNFKVTNLVRNNHYFSKQAPVQLSEKLIKIFKKEQIEVINCNNVTNINSSNIEFDEKRLKFNVAGIGIGLIRNDNLTNNNHKVDKFLKFKEDVYLIGDLAAVDDNGIDRSGGNWNNAIAQAVWLAKYLSNETETAFEFGRTSDYSTRFFGNTLVFMGYTNQDVVTNKITTDEENKLCIECYRGKTLVGAILFNTHEQRNEISSKLNV